MNDFAKLFEMGDSLEFFKKFKELSEEHWKTKELNKEVYGLQIQKDSKWKKGLSEHELEQFQLDLKLDFPENLKNFYRTMNGLSLPGVNVYGNDSDEKGFEPVFFSYPDDLDLIRDYINWIYNANKVDNEFLIKNKISRIFPVYIHRFILLDNEANQILSMHGNDIIFYAESISKLLMKDILGYRKGTISELSEIDLKFWLR